MAQSLWKRRRKKVRAPDRPRGDRGASQVEFCLSILTVVFVIFWMWEVIMAVYTLNVLSDAAKEGVRYAIVRGSRNDPAYQVGPGSTTAVENRVKDYARFSLHDTSAITVRVCYPPNNVDDPECTGGSSGTNRDRNRVRVVVLYNFIPYTALPVAPLLRAAAEGRVVF